MSVAEARRKKKAANAIKSRNAGQGASQYSAAANRATVEIRNHLTGEVMFSKQGRPGQAPTAVLRDLVAECMASPDPAMRDWSYADVRGMDFTELVMEGMIFDDALITGARFEGVRGSGMSFIRAQAQPTGSPAEKAYQVTSFAGFRSRGRTKFCAMKAENIIFDESIMIGASFRGASLHNMSARDVRWNRVILTHTDQVDCDYSHPETDDDKGRPVDPRKKRGLSKVRNCDWGNSINVRPNFKGTDLTDNMRNSVNAQMAKVHAEDIARISSGGARRKPGRKFHWSGHYNPTLDGELSVDGRVEAYQHYGRRFPNKYRNAVFVGTLKDKRTIGNSMIKWDVKAVAAKGAALFLIGLGGWTGVQMALDNPIDAVMLLANQSKIPGGMLFTTLTATMFTDTGKDLMKAYLIDPTWGRVKSAATDGYVALRRRIAPAVKELAMKGRVAITCGLNKDMGPLIRALNATATKCHGSGVGALWRYFTAGDSARIVVCNEDHLAAALGHISANRNRGYRMPRDLTLVRTSTDSWRENYPATVTFEKEGNTLISWATNGESSHIAAYDGAGALVWQYDLQASRYVVPEQEGLLPHVQLQLYGEVDDFGVRRSDDLIHRFENAITEDNGLEDFDYDRELQYVQASGQGKFGVGGDLLVFDKNTRKLSNTLGPAYIARDRHADVAQGESPWMAEQYWDNGEYISGEEHDRRHGHIPPASSWEPMSPDEMEDDGDDPELYNQPFRP